MMKNAPIKRFLTIRDRDKPTNGSHKRNRSSEGQKIRPNPAESFLSIFRNKNAAKSDETVAAEEERAAKLEQLKQQLVEIGAPETSADYLRFALDCKYAAGDVSRAVEIVQILHKSINGEIVPYNPHVEMVGAINRDSVTCYIDALLFAMYAKLEAFECMLKVSVTGEPERELALLVRLWINLLRTGKLIHVDLTEKLQEALAACGWEEAKLLEQQDTSEAFAFITEKLQLPLLTLQVDLFHQGKKDEGDHKKVYERLLNLAVPADPEGKGIKLEDCLEEYLNTKVDIMRDDLPDEKLQLELVSTPTEVQHIEMAKIDEDTPGGVTDAATEPRPLVHTDTGASTSKTPSGRPEHRPRASTGIIQRLLVDRDGKTTEATEENLMQKAVKKGSTVVKAVTIPAWQFFRFIPWGTTATAEPRTNTEVAKEFNQRPVVGICLKRYTMGEDGSAKRVNTYIDIPDSMRLPHFMMMDDTKVDEDNPLSADYKLVLQSVVCHRGDTVQSGHYISFARMRPKVLTENRRHSDDPPPDYEEAQWVKFDDLQVDQRVSYVEDIREAFKTEMPYLLFYQVVPMVEAPDSSVTGSVAEPPSYADSAVFTTHAAAATPDVGLSRPPSSYFESVTVPTSTGASIRFSSELERPPRLSLNDDDLDYQRLTNSSKSSRRGSTAQPDGDKTSSAITSEAVSPLGKTNTEEATAQRTSRTMSRFRPGASAKSRPTSQAGENRIALAVSKLAFRAKSKEPLREEDFVPSTSDPLYNKTNGIEEKTPNKSPAEPRVSIDDEKRPKEKENQKDKEKKGKGKSKDKIKMNGILENDAEKVGDKGNLPDRECVVM